MCVNVCVFTSPQLIVMNDELHCLWMTNDTVYYWKIGHMCVYVCVFNSLKLAATRCNSLHLAATHCISLQLTAIHCNPLQLTATHCNPLQLCHHLQFARTVCRALSLSFSLSSSHHNKKTHVIPDMSFWLHSPHIDDMSSCPPYRRGGGLGSSTIFKKFNEPYAPS